MNDLHIVTATAWSMRGDLGFRSKDRRIGDDRSEGRRVWQRTHDSPMKLLAASAVFGSWAFSAMAAPLSPENAAGHIGETATVCGLVASAEYEPNERSQPTLLDLGKPYPAAIFTAVIYGDNRQKFGTPETSLRGKRICVTGQISDYQGKPGIVLTEPSQLTQ
jgi:hypothetical protein